MSDAKRKGDEAQRLLSDPTLNEALDNIKANVVKQIEDSTFGQAREREEAYRMLRAVASFRGELAKMVRVAKGQAAEESEMARRTVLNLAER